MLEKLGKDDFGNYRLYGETESKNRINDLMEKTNYWINRETDILISYEKIDNVLAQVYNLKPIKYNIDIDDYSSFLNRLGYEGFSLINQTADLKKRQELLYAVNDVRSSELNDITHETRIIALGNTLEKGEKTSNERN